MPVSCNSSAETDEHGLLQSVFLKNFVRNRNSDFDTLTFSDRLVAHASWSTRIIPMNSTGSTAQQYLKRFRMEIDFGNVVLSKPKLPSGYEWSAWHPAQLADHAQVKYESFRAEMDSRIFPAFRSLQGCRDLMQSISTHQGFLPQATWLISLSANDFRPSVPCGTIQGLRQSATLGSIQNVGVVPEQRGCGLGRALLLKTLHGFRACGMTRVYLDVSADNTGAMTLYRSIGFQYINTSYREIRPEPTSVKA